ncbi:unnamed protein product [Ophioblennius macclurei]
MLGLQGTASSSRVYRCVACSATFNGLASLLVHQASHASVASKDPDLPSTEANHSRRDAPSESSGSSGERLSSEKVSSNCPSSFYICDCGEEFQDFTLMLEHKRSHNPQLKQPTDNPATPQLSFSPASKSDFVLSCTSTSMSPAAELPILPALKADMSKNDEIAIVTSPQGQRALLEEEERFENMSTTEEKMPETDEDMHFQVNTNSVDSADMTESVPSNDALMNLLVSTYTTHQSPNQNEDLVMAKREVVPVDITPGARTAEPPSNDLSIAQLRRLLAKPGIKTKSPSISKILDSSRKKVVSLTKTFSPVVLLETRHTLMDPSNNTYGRYQCGRCRRVFQNLNRLTEHHFLHKKERIKCCRRCKQLIIGRQPLPDNHVCPQFANKSKQSSGALKIKLPFAQKLGPFHGLSNTKKVFFCPLCKHSYARRWNLKTHKCQGPKSPLVQSHFSVQNMLSLNSPNTLETDEVKSEFNIKTVSVGTENANIKVESTSPTADQLLVSHLAWTHPAKQFSPFSAKSSIMEQHVDASLPGVSPQRGENNWDSQHVKNSREVRWRMPLDDEMEMLNSVEKAGGSRKSEPTEMVSHGLCYFVRDGVRRYPCSRCQKTYSRASTLRRHLRLCGLRLRGFGTGPQGGSQGAMALNTGLVKPMFACFVCGKNFNRKDNMMVHRKKCQLQRAVAHVDMGGVRQSVSASTTDSPAQEDVGANWGIMSLPSVLPRRVTCECGVGFTSPRLLLEHLQKHAQESYTCPTCGETVNSWADYEVHLQIHMHSRNQLLKGLQPQRSQPLLLRFQQQQAQQQQQQQQPPLPQPPQSAHQQPQRQVRPSTLLIPAKKQQRIVCTRCCNTFATRCSLRRHISWNRCKGGRITNQFAHPPKAYHCSNCNSDFPNAISLMFHQRSGACKPAIKPVRCPVCLRWFGAVDSLQKHLLTHKQSDAYRCDVCNGTYPNLKSLKNHRRRIHRILAGNTKPNTQEQLAS